MNGKSFLLRIAQALLLAALCSGCKALNSAGTEASHVLKQAGAGSMEAAPSFDAGAQLERIAEIERAGAFFPGLALLESELRENAGDYSGAAIAAYKELSWAYGYGNAAGNQIEEGLGKALNLFEAQYTGAARSSGITAGIDAGIAAGITAGITAVRGCMAFAREDWALAEELLSLIPCSDDEPDSFLRWMLLAAGFEREGKGAGEKARAERSAYGAIRARYLNFPEYWYRGARAFSERPYWSEAGSIAASYAEQCINTSPSGPFAAECRKILASHAGLGSAGMDARPGQNAGILTKAEIENIIRSAVSMNNPAVLEDLFPLMTLPENPYTLYALGALKTLSSVPVFRSFFDNEAQKSGGRLGERLNYISRG